MGDILFLAHRVPFPPDRGDKIRSYHVLKHLAARRRVHLCAFTDTAAETHAAPEIVRLTQSRTLIWRRLGQLGAGVRALLRRQPVSVAAFEDAAMAAAVEQVLQQHEIDVIYVFSSQMAQYVPVDARARVAMDFVDMDSAKFAGYADTAPLPKSWLFRREARLLLAHDRVVAERADVSIFVSQAEGRLFEQAGGGAGRVAAIGNGIDTDHFDPSAATPRSDAQDDLIVFTGQMNYPPNIAAVRWFADDILPHIRLRHPNVRFAIVGRAPTAEVRVLDARDDVIVTGEVEDVRGWLAAAAVVVAPLRLARGVQNKVLEAMAMAQAIVATSGAAEGIEHRGTIITADTPTEIANAVTALLDSPERARAQGAAARQAVIDGYGWDARLAPLDALLGLSPVVSAEQRSAA